MMMIYMGIDAEQPLENVLDNLDKVVWKRNTRITWEILLVIDEALGPQHYVCDIFVGWEHDWLLVLAVVLPIVLERWPCCHLWACLLCTVLCDWCEQTRKLIVEVDDANGEPIVEVFA